MKKTVFCSLTLRKDLIKCDYKVYGAKEETSGIEVYYPINAVLSKTLTNEDDLKVVLMKTRDIEGNVDVNEEVFKNELDSINENIGANIEYKVIELPFVADRDIHIKEMRSMIGEMEEGAHVMLDITFGPKPQAIAMFSALKFADKVYHSKIDRIVYGKVDFLNDKRSGDHIMNPVMYDLASLYYLNSIINSFEDLAPKKALDTLDALFNM